MKAEQVLYDFGTIEQNNNETEANGNPSTSFRNYTMHLPIYSPIDTKQGIYLN